VEDGSHRIVAVRTLIPERAPLTAGVGRPCRAERGVSMGVAKKAKREAKSIKGQTKKDASKAKHKGKKAKNAAKH
jgi:hypothetical protein